jgi:hypothetical protein
MTGDAPLSSGSTGGVPLTTGVGHEDDDEGVPLPNRVRYADEEDMDEEWEAGEGEDDYEWTEVP